MRDEGGFRLGIRSVVLQVYGDWILGACAKGSRGLQNLGDGPKNYQINSSPSSTVRGPGFPVWKPATGGLPVFADWGAWPSEAARMEGVLGGV